MTFVNRSLYRVGWPARAFFVARMSRCWLGGVGKAAGGFAPRGVCGNHTILPARRKCLDAVCQAHGILNPACPSIQLIT